MFQGVFGDKAGNSAGEYLSVDQQTGEVMIYVDADTIGGGYGFMRVRIIFIKISQIFYINILNFNIQLTPDTTNTSTATKYHYTKNPRFDRTSV